MRNIILFIMIVFLAGLFVLNSASNAHAQTLLPGDTFINLLPVDPVTMGESPIVFIQLMDVGSTPIPNQLVVLTVDGIIEGRSLTDLGGNVNFEIRPNLPAGIHELTVTFEGGGGYNPSNSTIEFVVKPLEFSVATVPATPGAQFIMEGQTFQADKDGIARIWIPTPGVFRLEVLPFEQGSNDFRAEFNRWEPNYFRTYREINIPETTSLTAGFELYYPVNMVFVDASGNPVNPDRISNLTVRSSRGSIINFEGVERNWLQKNHIVRRLKGLEDVIIDYSVQSVVVDGSNVVNQGQQRFTVSPNSPWVIELLIFPVKFSVREALFGYRIGEGIQLQHPDGNIESYYFETEPEIAIDSLARGDYVASVIGAGGFSIPIPVVVSRSKEVELLVISYPSIGAVFLVPALLAVMLLLIGRPGIVIFLRNRMGLPGSNHRKNQFNG